MKSLDLDTDTIKSQAKDLYNDIKDYADQIIDSGILTKIGNAIVGFIKKIIDYFS